MAAVEELGGGPTFRVTRPDQANGKDQPRREIDPSAQAAFHPADSASRTGPRQVKPRTKPAAGVDRAKLIVACGIVGAILIAIPILLRNTPSGWIIDIPIAVIATAFAVASGAFRHLLSSNERVGLTDGFIYRVNAFGLRRRWALHDLLEVVRVKAFLGMAPSGYAPPVAGVVDVYLIINKRGRAVASLISVWPRFVWPREAMTRLWQEAELPIREPWPKSVGVREIRQRYPGALPGLKQDSDHESPLGAIFRISGATKTLFAGIGCFLGFTVALVLGFMGWLFGWSFSPR